jgi:D-sedoheptulose 7-phosphate isomerase
MHSIQDYISLLQQTLDQLPRQLISDVIDVLQTARMQGSQIFIMGNGGSAATASHFVCDLAKNTRREGLPPFRVIGLTDNMAILSAYANDEGYEQVFAQQLASLIRPRDVVIAISASGNSKNVIQAIEEAQKHDVTTVAFTGFDGGRVGQIVNINIHVKSNIIEHVEDVHLVLEHIIVKMIKDQVQVDSALMAPLPGLSADVLVD